MSKKIGIGSELLLINILVFVLILFIILFSSDILRIILGLPLLLFFPGYVLMAALFPKKGEPAGIERVGLSFGLSIGVTILVALVVNYTPWGLGLNPVLVALAVFIVATSAVAYYRRRRLPGAERFVPAFQIVLPRWGGLSNLDKALSIVLVLSILGGLGVLGYVIAAPKAGEKFTEFYVLADYPRELATGEEATVTLGIVNNEGQEVSYNIEVTIDAVKNAEVGPLVLADEERWEGEVGFVPQEVGQGQKVEFLLFKDGESEPYETLHFFIDVFD